MKNEYPECWTDQSSKPEDISIPAWVLLHADLLGCLAKLEQIWTEQNAPSVLPTWREGVAVARKARACSSDEETDSILNKVILGLVIYKKRSSFVVCATQDYIENRDEIWGEVFRSFDTHEGFSYVEYEYEEDEDE